MCACMYVAVPTNGTVLLITMLSVVMYIRTYIIETNRMNCHEINALRRAFCVSFLQVMLLW